jgi:uncharacterized protein YlxP (DUF503 family)
MLIGTAQITIFAPWVHSLKEKRMVVRSICAKVRNKFNVSIAEVDAQDLHQRIVLGFACIAGDAAMADSMIDNILNFIENNSEGEIIDILKELR